MKKSYLIFALLFLNTTIYAQSIYNIQAELDRLNRQIIISYDLVRGVDNTKFDKFEIAVYISLDSGKTFEENSLTYVSGGIGRGIASGNNKKIQWRYLVEKPDFTGKGVVFKIKARLDTEDYATRLKALKGTKGALYSLLLPGWGDYKVREGTGYWGIGALTYGLVGSGLGMYLSAKNNYDKYENATTLNEADTFLKNSQNQSKLSQILLGAGALVWLTDIVLVLKKGAKNQRDLATYNASQKATSRLHINVLPAFGGFSLGLKLSY
jgi:hypothetical protein